MQFGERVKQLRKQRKISQEMLGIKAGCGQGAVSGWETQGAEPPYETLVNVANAFGVTTDYLVGRTDNPLSSSVPKSPFIEVSHFEKSVLEAFRNVDRTTQSNICMILGLTHPAVERDKTKRA